MFRSQNLFGLERLGNSCVSQDTFLGFPEMTSEDLETVRVQESYGANGTGNWSQSRAEPPAVKKRQPLPQEGTGTGGKGAGLPWAEQLHRSRKREDTSQLEKEQSQGWTRPGKGIHAAEFLQTLHLQNWLYLDLVLAGQGGKVHGNWPLDTPVTRKQPLPQTEVKVKVAQSCPTLCHTHIQSMEFSRPEYWSG